MTYDKGSLDAESIFRAALKRVDPYLMVKNCLAVQGGFLEAKTELEEARYDLSLFDRILVLGFGKGAAAMAKGAEAALVGLDFSGLAVIKEECLDPPRHIARTVAAHPIPDSRSEEAASRILSLARAADERTLVLVLISGGGSSLLCAPAPGLSLEDKAACTKLLLASGAAIQEVNCVRKHLSAVKGGLLAAAAAPATVLSLILSDVMGDDLDAIASGPTVPDRGSFADALELVNRHGLAEKMPESVMKRLAEGAAGTIPETPKPGDEIFARVRNMLIGTNRLALMAAGYKARELGYSTLLLSSRLAGEAREAALVLHGIAADIAESGFPLARPACVIAGGETTVTLRGSGKGGRNQEMALSFLSALGKMGLNSASACKGLAFLAASTDGSDGPTDATGAFASLPLLAESKAAGLDIQFFLANNDSYAFFDKLDALLKTGPTGTNVCDLAILVIPEKSGEGYQSTEDPSIGRQNEL